jgi:hypothetical protein
LNLSLWPPLKMANNTSPERPDLPGLIEPEIKIVDTCPVNIQREWASGAHIIPLCCPVLMI